jgi:hypothetical protein
MVQLPSKNHRIDSGCCAVRRGDGLLSTQYARVDFRGYRVLQAGFEAVSRLTGRCGCLMTGKIIG